MVTSVTGRVPDPNSFKDDVDRRAAVMPAHRDLALVRALANGKEFQAIIGHVVSQVISHLVDPGRSAPGPHAEIAENRSCAANRLCRAPYWR